MAVIPQFETRAALVAALRRSPWKSWFRETRSRRWTIHDVILRSVAANTFRYFRNLPSRPSLVFRRWAEDTFGDPFVQRLAAVRRQDEFDDLVRKLSLSLRRRWNKEMSQQMKAGPSIKLPNLVLKHLAASQLVTMEASQVLAQLLHVPLDSYTLGAIRDVHNAGRYGVRYQVRRGAGMGSITTWTDYRLVQRTVFDVATEAGAPPIAFDILAWNRAHQQPRP